MVSTLPPTTFPNSGIGRGELDWRGELGETSISRTAPNPPALAGIALQTPISIANLTTLAPKFKFILGGLWSIDAWTINLKEEIYGPTVGYLTPGSGRTANFPVFFVVNGANYYQIKTPTTPLTDLDVSYAFTEHVSMTVGASNLTNQTPPINGVQTNGQPIDSGTQYSQPRSQSPYGINGGFYFGRINFNW